MAFRAQIQGETIQQYQLRQTLFFYEREFVLEPVAVPVDGGVYFYDFYYQDVVAAEIYDSFVAQLADTKALVENPPSTFGQDCFELNTANAQQSIPANALYAASFCGDYFREVSQSIANVEELGNQLASEMSQYLTSWASENGFQYSEAGLIRNPGEVAQSTIDQQENIFEERDQVLDSVTQPKVPWWLYAAGAGALVLVFRQ
jgi:hypothetical protein